MRQAWRLVTVLGRVAVGSALLLAAGCGEDSRVAGGRDSAGLTQDHVVQTGQACTPTGKHFEHRNYGCATCHMAAGTLCFDPSVAGPTAAFDATAKTCSNVACHTVPSGTFTYVVWDWGCECLVENSVPYGGGTGTPPYWYSAAGLGCNACHGYPPKYNGAAYTWHSGAHGFGISNGNACQLCHPDATGAYVYGGPPSYAGTSGGAITSCAPGTYCAAPGAITNASLHGNGVLDVTPAWTGNCIGCH
jgi:hypothetical protein